ncbi:MAG TPA: methylated-DNA--[protein]-cysteine S-methyltransferase [Spirochaetota bacterium]|nr:methylated-DNA--[protein]-cysteine S-methyltransferase [Spirochaetota bacterium]
MDCFYHKTPAGKLEICADKNGLVTVRFKNGNSVKIPPNPHIKKTVSQLNHFFSGKITSFSLTLKLKGTAFQTKIWQTIKNIPYGTTVSYRNLAAAAGYPRAYRAAAAACKANRFAVIIPCHRVIKSNGRTGGYSAGRKRKEKLLALEKTNKAF